MLLDVRESAGYTAIDIPASSIRKKCLTVKHTMSDIRHADAIVRYSCVASHIFTGRCLCRLCASDDATIIIAGYRASDREGSWWQGCAAHAIGELAGWEGFGKICALVDENRADLWVVDSTLIDGICGHEEFGRCSQLRLAPGLSNIRADMDEIKMLLPIEAGFCATETDSTLAAIRQGEAVVCGRASHLWITVSSSESILGTAKYSASDNVRPGWGGSNGGRSSGKDTSGLIGDMGAEQFQDNAQS